MDDILINIDQGTLKGTTGTDIDGKLYYAFLGIPYAKPPIGKLRFKAPQPPEKWSGVRDASKDGNACYSRESVSRIIIGKEDCLFLNVYTPLLPDKDEVDLSLRPVMVYIHGGAFTAGSNTAEMYGPQFLLTDNIVLVVINYRLGLLGFLAFDDGRVEVPGNAGCKDMVMALKWVKSNIKHFGGDPNNVTIFGESAGGAAVHLLVLSPMAKGLFHRAIIQSGSALNPWAIGKPSANELAQVLNCPYTKNEDILNYLQDLPVEKILEGQEKLPDDFLPNFVRPLGPVIEKGIPNENTFLSEHPLDIILDGSYNHVPIIIGYTAREGIFFEMLEKKRKRTQVIEDFETVIPNYFSLERGSDISKSIGDKIRTFYFGDRTHSSGDRENLCLVYSDTVFIRDIYNTAKNHATSSTTPLYLYRFSLDASLNFYKNLGALESAGASHADELGYLFKTFLTPNELDPDSIELKSVRRIVKLWTNFAKTGDPNSVENVVWKPVTQYEMNFLDIDEELTTGINPDEIVQPHGILRYCTSTSEPIVKVEQGLLRGTTGKDYDGKKFYKFLGIPYAKPPIGRLRFKPPQPAEEWEGIRDATKDGNESYSRDFFKGVVGSEDCLFLNVYTPKLPENGTLKPVMVWIHGGGFVWGSNNSQMYGPEFLITEDVIIVAINYRLGVLGFLSLENPDLEITGNAGCKDMVMALKWVQNNIKYFGGNPENVTIFGQSAGGVAVHLLVLSPMAKGLFHRAIAQSGSALNTWSICRPFKNDLMQILRFTNDNEELILKHLQELSVEKLFQAQEKIRDRFYPQFMRSIGPTIENISIAEGAFIDRDPLHTIAEGQYAKVPIMMGYTSREAFFLMTTSGKQTNKDKLYIDFERYVPNFLNIQVGSDLSKQIAKRIREFYFADRALTVEQIDKYYLMQSDGIFVRGVYSSVRNHCVSTEPLFLYRFSVDASLNIYKKLRQIDIPGASHADDICYLFKSSFVRNIRPNSVEDKTIRRMAKLWVNFARSGNPNPIKDVTWKPVTREELHFLDIGSELDTGVNPDHERMQYNVAYLVTNQSVLKSKGPCILFSSALIIPTMVIINIEQGCLKGKTGVDYNGKKYHAFLGIPYAKPPVGELRFKAPQPLERWHGIKDATKDGSPCYSRDMIKGVIGSEDCLCLNVFTSTLPEESSQLKPVMVWIHGGAFILGSNTTETYGPEYLLTGDVVIVTINYRIGVLGFLAMDDVDLDVPGNAGCKDMVLALKWVQKNIKKFNGDPDNVTIFGESAGGTAVHLLVLSPLAKGLFHKAIAQSGSALLPWSIAKPCYKELAATLECPYTEEKKILRFLQELPVEKLHEGQEKMDEEFSSNTVRLIGPVIEKSSAYDEPFLTEQPLDILLKGNYNKVPLMMGYTSKEGLLFDMRGQVPESESDFDFEKYVPNFFNVNPGSDSSKSIAEKIKAFYLGNNFTGLNFRDKIYMLRTDTYFMRGIYSSVKHHAVTSPGLVFLYRFSVDAGLNIFKIMFKINSAGACHGDDVGYLFKTALPLSIEPNGVEDKTIRRMVKLWTNFAKIGDPNPIEDITWRPVFQDEVNFLDIVEKLTMEESPEKERMKFWDNIFALTPETINY
ncbi:hypothetical protein Trydic_g15495 [Trypoxylus dichotomus]